MNKTKIEWCDMTWSPVSGCLHGCKYCYARKIAKRFGGWDYSSGHVRMNIAEDKTYIALDGEVFHNWGCNVYENNGYKVAELEHPYLIERGCKTTKAPYPFGFSPTFHKYRLDEPQQIKKPQRIFVCGMADLFGEWVPNEWQLEVYNACGKADWHKYLFLTKNPEAYSKVFYRSKLDYRYNFWLGTAATDDKSFYEKGYDLFESTGCDQKRHAHRFLSIEPLLGEISDTTLRNIQFMDWIIIGQQTNPNKPPKDEWVQSIIDQCRAAGVPVFVKSPLFEKFPIQEWPEGLK